MAIKFPTRFDPTLTVNGVWFNIFSEAGDHYGDYKLGCVDASTPFFKLRMEEIERRQKALKLTGPKGKTAKPIAPSEEEARKQTAEFFVDFCLLDWANLPGEDEKTATPYSRDAAIAVFSEDSDDVRWLMDKLYLSAKDVTHFRPEQAPEKN